MAVAFWLLTLAVLLGVVAVSAVLREQRPASALAIAHGGAGALGLALFLAALPTTKATPGTEGFGRDAAWLLAIALMGGLFIAWLGSRGRRPPGLLIAIHGSLAVCGYVLLVALW